MAEISDLSDLVNRATGGNNGTPETIFFHKTGRYGGTAFPTLSAGRANSLWRADGSPAGAPAPTTAIIPTNATDGALKQTDPGGSRQKWIYQFGISTATAGTFILYDRLFQIGGLSGTVTTAQTVQGSPASPALTRYSTNATCVGNMILVEINTALGGSSTTLTAKYTNQAGTGAQVSGSITFGGSAATNHVTRCFLVPLASGDTGVQAVESVTLAASTGTAGDFSVAIIRPLGFVAVPVAACATFRDFATGLPGIPEVLTDAALALLYIPTFTSFGETFGAVSMVEA